MTAEIAVMNKEAVALAADSAITMEYAIGEMRGQKICTSANKLFMLSKYHPVGIMIYANASFMDIPWESIIKIYRKKLGEVKFDTLEEYADDFISFLENDKHLFPEEQKREYLRIVIYKFFYHMRREIFNQIQDVIKKQNKMPKFQITDIIEEFITSCLNELERKEFLRSFTQELTNNIVSKYIDDINEAIGLYFEKLPVNDELKSKLRMITGYLFSKDIFISGISGIVIAGFGERDIFPSVKSFIVEGIVSNNLRYKCNEDKSSEINYQNTAAIIAFAQSDMVVTFMEGLDPNLELIIESYLTDSFKKYFEFIVREVACIDEEYTTELKTKLQETIKEIIQNYKKHIEKNKRQNQIQPIIQVVAMLPKDELAAMAESLVNLTSFKRKVTTDSETVGGPIDVAVISKGDGFVWVQRKHYFKAELNPHFFANYYRGDKDGKEGDEKRNEEQE